MAINRYILALYLGANALSAQGQSVHLRAHGLDGSTGLLLMMQAAQLKTTAVPERLIGRSTWVVYDTNRAQKDSMRLSYSSGRSSDWDRSEIAFDIEPLEGFDKTGKYQAAAVNADRIIRWSHYMGIIDSLSVQYNAQQRAIARTHYNAEGNRPTRAQYFYSTTGELYKAVYGKLATTGNYDTCIRYFIYDLASTWIKTDSMGKRYYNGPGSYRWESEKTVFTYNPEGLLAAEDHFINGKLRERKTYDLYDSLERLVLVQHYDVDTIMQKHIRVQKDSFSYKGASPLYYRHYHEEFQFGQLFISNFAERTVDPQGRTTEFNYFDYIGNGNYIFSQQTKWYYNQAGNPLRSVINEDQTGVPHEITTYYYEEVLSAKPIATKPADFIRAYPSPAASVLHVDFISQPKSSITIEIMNAGGQRVYEAYYGAVKSKEQIDISAFAPGNYFITVTDLARQASATKAFLKQ